MVFRPWCSGFGPLRLHAHHHIMFLETFYRIVGTEAAKLVTSELKQINKQLTQIERKLETMPTEAELDAAIAELKQEISNAAQRVLDAIAAATANNPDLTDELADIKTATEDLKKIGAPAPPAS